MGSRAVNTIIGHHSPQSQAAIDEEEEEEEKDQKQGK